MPFSATRAKTLSAGKMNRFGKSMNKRINGPTLAAALMSSLFVLNGCSAISDTLGANKYPPDEFAVVAKTPLIMPPDYNLHPPGLSDPKPREVDTSELAMRALFPEPEENIGTQSPAEFQLMQSSGAGAAGPDARSNLSPRDDVVSKGTATEDILYGEPVGGGSPIVERDSVPEIDR